MDYRLRFSSLTFVALLTLVSSVAYAGAPGSTNREPLLLHTCRSGPHAGMVCTNDAQCQYGTCEIAYGSPVIRGKLTVVMDEHVVDLANNPQTPRGKALTVVLEVKKAGKTHFFAETYQNSPDAFLPPRVPAWANDPNVTECAVMAKVLTNLTDFLDDFLFQQPDSTIVQGLRDLFGVTGIPMMVPVVARTGPRVESSFHVMDTDPGTACADQDFLGSTARFPVDIRFAQEAP